MCWTERTERMPLEGLAALFHLSTLPVGDHEGISARPASAHLIARRRRLFQDQAHW